MSASTPDKVLLACPHCGHQQTEPPSAISSVCRKCGRHFRVQEVLRPATKVVERAPNRRKVTCFECGSELDVPVSAESTMCKRCSQYVDLKDYRIANAVSKNFKTKGMFVVEPKGYVFNTEAIVGEAVIKGRFLGKLTTERSLTIYSGAEIKGSFKAGRLVIPADNHFSWKELIKAGSADIAGELDNDLEADDTIILRATARMFGNVQARNLVVEAGAIIVGSVRVGFKGS
ncbi:MAG: hypothetical protein HOP33_20385 [Verrucomicrobia bacterium]|nr:hypothetical protein [Verrucomicrobiota bacterium]